LPPEVESARHFDLNITQWELPLVMRHLNSQSRHASSQQPITSLSFGRNVCAGL